jgi:hypothetical protein
MSVFLEATIQQQQSTLAEKLHNKPFWIWNLKEHKQEDIRTKGIAALIISLVYRKRVK